MNRTQKITSKLFVFLGLFLLLLSISNHLVKAETTLKDPITITNPNVKYRDSRAEADPDGEKFYTFLVFYDLNEPDLLYQATVNKQTGEYGVTLYNNTTHSVINRITVDKTTVKPLGSRYKFIITGPTNENMSGDYLAIKRNDGDQGSGLTVLFNHIAYYFGRTQPEGSFHEYNQTLPPKVPVKISYINSLTNTEVVDPDGKKYNPVVASGYEGQDIQYANYPEIKGFQYVRTDKGSVIDILHRRFSSDRTYLYLPKQSGKVIVSYRTVDGTPLTQDVELSGEVNTPYATEEKTFAGYTLKEITGNVTGVYTNGTTKVNYVYKKNEPTLPSKTGSVQVVYVDEQGNPIDKKVTLTGPIGDGLYS